MALFRKLGGLLSQTASRNLLSESCVTKPSILQAVRCMSSMASSKLFVGGLSYATDDFQLKEAFTKYGQVIEARVIVDRETGRSRGFGFVTFTSTEEASSAIQAMDGQALYGRNVRVNYATERARGGFGGNYGGPGGAYGDNYGGSNYGPGGGNYGPQGGNYGPQGGNYGPQGGNYGPPGGDFAPSGANYGPPGGDYAPSGGVGGGNYGGSPDFGTGSQYAGGSTYGNVAGGGGGSASFGGSGAGSGFEGRPDLGFGNVDQMDTDVTDKIDESTGGFEEGDIVDGNYRDEDDDGDFAKRA